MQTYTIPQGTKELTIETYNDKIVIEFVPEKTFKTEDGIIKFGDEFWHVDSDLCVSKGKWLKGEEFIVIDGYKIFSSEQAARQYVAEKTWEPKDGEVCYNEDNESISIFKDADSDIRSSVHCGIDHLCRFYTNSTLWSYPDRPATPSESQLLFDKLAEAGYRWNAEEKKVEKVRWRARRGELYWTIINGSISWRVDDKNVIDNGFYNSGLYFRTRTQAEAAFEAVKNLLLNTEF